MGSKEDKEVSVPSVTVQIRGEEVQPEAVRA